jgi:hypothetical protein
MVFENLLLAFAYRRAWERSLAGCTARDDKLQRAGELLVFSSGRGITDPGYNSISNTS